MGEAMGRREIEGFVVREREGRSNKGERVLQGGEATRGRARERDL